MGHYDELRHVTIIDVDRRAAGTAKIPHGDLLRITKQIADGARLIHLDKRFGVHEKYLPVHRIAEIRVERVHGIEGDD